MPNGSPTAIIFDLDGTLIDSAPSILASFARALEAVGLEPLCPLDSSLIGPPLRQTLTNLTGVTDSATLDLLTAHFKASYDSEGYKESRLYPGIPELLATLHAAGVTLAIATNKRRVPTVKIVEHFGWGHLFRLVGTLDSPERPHADKGALIAAIVDEMGIDARSSVYIGDKWEDGNAATVNGMMFIAAGWGYGNWNSTQLPDGWTYACFPGQIRL